MEETAPRQETAAHSGLHVGLQGRIVTLLLLVSLLPLGLVGIGGWLVFGRLLEAKALEVHENIVRSHAANIELYLAERVRALELATRTTSRQQLGTGEGLRRAFHALDESYGGAFVDLGSIAADGRHVAYVGPYDLAGRNYADAQWFRDVMARGSYVSDVFLGYRHLPHFIVAVKRDDDGDPWVLRATINGDRFDALVRTEALGETGDTYIVDARGKYQTPPRLGDVLGQSPIRSPVAHRGIRSSRVSHGESGPLLRTTTWINGGRWLLVAEQSEAEVQAPLRRAMVGGAVVVVIAVILVVVTTFLSTRHLVRRIDRANEQRDEMARDLLRSAKLASLGELATGLAHEINNPLAIIGAEQTNIGDIVEEKVSARPERDELLESVERCKKHVARCGVITSKMLQFGRHGRSNPEPTDIAATLEETVELLQRQSRVRNVELRLRVDPSLPRVLVDATELEQVLVNLINNSLYAIKQSGHIDVAARTNGEQVLLTVTDDGSGIAREDLDRIFQPFFTTKPVGMGTGLGLAVCYGMVRGWGGTIEATSEPGVGTTFTIRMATDKSGSRMQGSR